MSVVVLSTIRLDSGGILYSGLQIAKSLSWVLVVQLVIQKSMKPTHCGARMRGIPLLCHLVNLFLFCASSLPLLLKALFICCSTKNNVVIYHCLLSLLIYCVLSSVLPTGGWTTWPCLLTEIMCSLLILMKLARMLRINWKQLRQPERLRIRYLQESCMESTLM